MSPRLAHFLTLLYPAAWRQRYGVEFESLLETGRTRFGTPFDVAWSAIREHIHPTQRVAAEQEFPAHTGRLWLEPVPSSMFCLAAMLMLAGAYAIACLILWAGWRMFLPGLDSPFGAREHGFANLYFQAGKYYFGAAPILVGWWYAVIAVRKRVRLVWLTIGLLLVAWMGAGARIQAGRATVHGGFGHISMAFDFRSLIQNARGDTFHAATILLLAAFPYLLWRFQKARRSVS